MDTILVVNAGSSSVKFQVFGIGRGDKLDRLVKGQVEGIGTRPRLTTQGGDKTSLVDRSYATGEVADVPAAIGAAADWLRESQRINLVAVGHRVVHGGPEYDRPMLSDQTVVKSMEQYAAVCTLNQPNDL